MVDLDGVDLNNPGGIAAGETVEKPVLNLSDLMDLG